MTTKRMGVRLLMLAAVLVLALGAASAQDETPVTADAYADSPALVTTSGTPEGLCEAAGEPAAPDVRSWTMPERVLEDGVDYRAIFCTTAGAIYFDLFENETPLTVNNLVFLAYNGYYNDTIFHRVLADFMAQGGDPTGTGTGGPGYQFPDEFQPYLFFDRVGLLAMANAGAGTNGSQFFITTQLTPHLDFRHTIFGEVLEGYENVEAIQLRDPGAPDPSVEPTTLKTVLIVKDPSLVETTFVEGARPTQADVEASLSSEGVLAAADALFQAFPADEVVIDETIFTAETAVEAAPNSVKAALEAFLADNEIEHVVSSTMTAANCSLDVLPFISISYTVYTTPSVQAAKAALDDANLPVLGIAGGQTTIESTAFGQPVYVGETGGCNVTAKAGRVFYTRGRYVIEAEAVIAADSQYTPAIVIERLSSVIFDSALGGVLRASIR